MSDPLPWGLIGGVLFLLALGLSSVVAICVFATLDQHLSEGSLDSFDSEE